MVEQMLGHIIRGLDHNLPYWESSCATQSFPAPNYSGCAWSFPGRLGSLRHGGLSLRLWSPGLHVAHQLVTAGDGTSPSKASQSLCQQRCGAVDFHRPWAEESPGSHPAHPLPTARSVAARFCAVSFQRPIAWGRGGPSMLVRLVLSPLAP